MSPFKIYRYKINSISKKDGKTNPPNVAIMITEPVLEFDEIKELTSNTPLIYKSLK